MTGFRQDTFAIHVSYSNINLIRLLVNTIVINDLVKESNYAYNDPIRVNTTLLYNSKKMSLEFTTKKEYHSTSFGDFLKEIMYDNNIVVLTKKYYTDITLPQASELMRDFRLDGEIALHSGKSSYTLIEDGKRLVSLNDEDAIKGVDLLSCEFQKVDLRDFMVKFHKANHTFYTHKIQIQDNLKYLLDNGAINEDQISFKGDGEFAVFRNNRITVGVSNRELKLLGTIKKVTHTQFLSTIGDIFNLNDNRMCCYEFKVNREQIKELMTRYDIDMNKYKLEHGSSFSLIYNPYDDEIKSSTEKVPADCFIKQANYAFLKFKKKKRPNVVSKQKDFSGLTFKESVKSQTEYVIVNFYDEDDD